MFNYMVNDAHEDIYAYLTYCGLEVANEIRLSEPYDYKNIIWSFPLTEQFWQDYLNDNLQGNVEMFLATKDLVYRSEPIVVLDGNKHSTAPIVLCSVYDSVSHNFVLKIQNQNSFEVELSIVCSSIDYVWTMQANSTLTLTNDGSNFANHFATLFNYYENGSLKDDCYCYFDNGDFVSDNTIILEANY